MTTEQIIHTAEIALIVIAVGIGIFRFILMECRLYKRDRCPVETAPAVAWFKHPDMEPVLTGRASTYVCYITFHTDAGESLKLYMTRVDFYSIEENSRGLLTWQGTRFWKFEQEV